MNNNEYKTVHCAGGCPCTAVVPNDENWIKKLIDTTNNEHNSGSSGDRWMVLLHGMHVHAIPFCSLACISEWTEHGEFPS